MNLGRCGVEVQRGARSSAGAQIEATSFSVWVSVNLIVSNRCATYIPLPSYNMPMSARGIFGRKTKRGGTRWVSLLLGVGIVLVTGTVLADVVLTYTLDNTVGGATTSPFNWEESTNYNTANTFGLINTGTCTPGAISTGANTCYSLTSAVKGVEDVPTVLLNVVDLYSQGTIPASYSAVLGISVGTAAVAGLANGCAYAIISNYQMLPGDIVVPSYASPCTITVTPNGGVANNVCGILGAGDAVDEINLVAPTSGTAPGCTVPSATAGASLFVSYYLFVPSADASTVTGNADIYVTATIS